MPILNPNALKKAKIDKGWTQLQLSEATKPRINVSTISRIERGKPRRVREITLNQFAKALGISAKELSDNEIGRDSVKFQMGSLSRNALRLIAGRYGVDRDHIVELAPLLFFIIAEKSLQARRKHLKTVREAANTFAEVRSGIGHLRLHSPIDEDALKDEENSINARDLTGEMITNPAYLHGDPYTTPKR